MRHAHILISSVALIAAAALSGCRSDNTAAQNAGTSNGSPAVSHVATLTLPSGTALDVSLGSSISSETASVGDGWSGTIRNGLIVNGKDIVPAGSAVSGTVTSVTSARKGDRAMLDLGLTAVTVGDHTYRVHGVTESVIAGSPRARNLGAIAGAAAAGAIIGHAVGNSRKGTVIGGLVGAGAAAGAVANSKGWQVVLKEGSPLTFTTNESVAVRL